MSFAPAGFPASRMTATRPLVAGLFIASCLLSVVSWYTRSRAWHFTCPPGSRCWHLSAYRCAGFGGLADRVYANSTHVTHRRLRDDGGGVDCVFPTSACSHGSPRKSGPVAIERRLYDRLNQEASNIQEVLNSAGAEGQKHVLALRELTEAEKTHGHISQAEDADPYLAKVREAVAREAQTYASSYKEGSGEGVRLHGL